MGIKKENVAIAVVEPPKTGALAVANDADFKDKRGKEDLDQSDLTLPRLAICQNTSPEKDRDDGKFIEGLEEGDLFNTLTQQNYGRGPLEFAVIRVDKRALEFEKDAEGKPTKVIKNFNVPWDDPRNDFSDGPNGQRLKPVATRFYDYIVFLPATFEPAVLSMSNTKIKVAKRLNSLLALRHGAAWKGLFKVSSVKEEKNGKKFFNYKVDPAGPSPDNVVEQAQGNYETYSKRTVTVDRETVHDDVAEGTVVEGENIPF